MLRIRDLREDMDLRQIDVAKATGIDQKTLSNYETGKTHCRTHHFTDPDCPVLSSRMAAAAGKDRRHHAVPV